MAVEPPAAQPLNKKMETAITTLARVIAICLQAIFVRFIVVGLADI